MRPSYDVVIVGGAVIGSSVAYFLAANPDFKGSVLVVERDPTYRTASTSLSSSSIRTQFSNPINVKISQFGSAFIRDFAETMQVGSDRPDLGFEGFRRLRVGVVVDLFLEFLAPPSQAFAKS